MGTVVILPHKQLNMKVMVSENNLISTYLKLDCGVLQQFLKKLCKRTNENATTIEIYNVVCYMLESKSYVGIDLSNQCIHCIG